ncbi:hypothetical protein [Streptomyces sp. V1I1]|uniref:hypothetical protein n=1 Tax=Streptomyces sp. V1I1 TaxID=3042272 RepID=UPI00278A7B97|nr:hypothetical protein [Streptomyces sp. V1I1]MDQ0945453.1 hypothetical protein [Streptomyces sp. V1I1]
MTENRPRGAMNPEQQTPTLEDLLAAAARPMPSSAEAEVRAVAAFRAARDEGASAALTRPEEDWRQKSPGAGTRWIKVGIGALVAGAMLGGVAMAAGAIPTPFGEPPLKPGPTPGASSRHSEHPGEPEPPSMTRPGARTPGERPPTAKDDLAHCRVYESKEGRGGALDGTAWQRLEDAAGGPDAVAAYCARLLSEQPVKASPQARPPKGEGGRKDTPPAGQQGGSDSGVAQTKKPPGKQ